MKKPQNDSFYKVGTKYMYEQFADSTNFKKVNTLPKVKTYKFLLLAACITFGSVYIYIEVMHTSLVPTVRQR